jgi:hypothetical protein
MKRVGVIKGLGLLIASLVLPAVSLPNSAAAKRAQIRLEDGVIRIKGAAVGRGRSLWARGKSLVLVLPPKTLRSEQTKLLHPHAKEIRIAARRNRCEVDIRLHARAESLLGKVRIAEKGKDLLITIGRPVVLGGAAKTEKSNNAGATASAPAKRQAAQPASSAANAPQKQAAASSAPSKQQALAKTLGRKNKAKPSWMKKNEQQKGPFGGTGSFAVFGLMLVGGAVVFYLRKKKGAQGGNNAEISVLSSRALSGRQKLVLVEAEGERLLLACTDKEVRLLRSKNGTPELADNTVLDGGPVGGVGGGGVDPLAEYAASLEDRVETRLGAGRMWNKAASSSKVGSGRFVEQLNQQLRSKRDRLVADASSRGSFEKPQPQRVASRHSDDEMPLDEKWAEGILRLRRSKEAAKNLNLQ